MRASARDTAGLGVASANAGKQGLTGTKSRLPTPRDSFSLQDWGLLAAIALMWGSSFIFIDEALEAFAPPLIAMLRLMLGAGTLVCFSQAWAPIESRDWRAITVLAFFWMAAPFILFPVAQQWIDSSLAGMINGSVPIFAAFVAAVVSRTLPAGRQVLGILMGFAGVLVLSSPTAQGARSTALGVLLVLVASIFYGVALNIAVPLQRRYGSLAVLFRAQVVALAMVAIPGSISVAESSFSWTSLAAVVPLGCLGTALAFVAMGTLAGRVGAARASLAIYFIPIVAIVLGWLLRDERIAFISIVGTGMVIAGAALASRRRISQGSISS
jgi:drug/metabolite transporter (DMT)-like permease